MHDQVGELTGILSQDLGAMKDLVNENVSRDRGFRAFSEVDPFSNVGLPLCTDLLVKNLPRITVSLASTEVLECQFSDTDS